MYMKKQNKKEHEMFKKRRRKNNYNLKVCKKCNFVYTDEEDGICITCKSKIWLNTKPNNYR